LGSDEVGLFQIDSNISSLISKIQGHTGATTKAQFIAWDLLSQILLCSNDQRLILWDILQQEETPSDNNVPSLGIPMEQLFFDWKVIKMRWRQENNINNFITYDMDCYSAMVIVCNVSSDITIYLMEG